MCGQSGSYFLTARDENRLLSTDYFVYYRCFTCATIFIESIPKNLSDYYPEDFYAIPQTVQQLEQKTKYWVHQIRMVQENVSSGKLLDIGCSFGTFLLQAEQTGFKAEGIEMDSRCARFVTERLGIPVLCTNKPHETLKSMGKFNVITLWHVLEHYIEPNLLLSVIAKHLMPDGILIVATPNPSSFQFRYMKNHWPHLDAPRHLQLIPHNALVDQVRQYGLSQVKFTCIDKGGINWNVFGWRKYLVNRFGVQMTRMDWVAGRLIEMVFRPWERRNEQGTAYTIILRKDQL